MLISKIPLIEKGIMHDFYCYKKNTPKILGVFD